MIYFLCFGVIALSLMAYASPSWSELAMRFTAESAKAREDSIRELRKIENLHEILTKELDGAKRPLALDVIGTLRLYDFVPQLQKVALVDRSGMTIVALNSLMTLETQKSFATYYLKLLAGDQVSSAAKVIIIETLSRLQVALGQKLSTKLFSPSQSPEIRSALLSYIRTEMRRASRKSYYFEIIFSALEQEPFQLRLQALFLIAELNKKDKLKFAHKVNQCMQDSHLEVRKFCRSLRTKGGGVL